MGVKYIFSPSACEYLRPSANAIVHDVASVEEIHLLDDHYPLFTAQIQELTMTCTTQRQTITQLEQTLVALKSAHASPARAAAFEVTTPVAAAAVTTATEAVVPLASEV